MGVVPRPPFVHERSSLHHAVQWAAAKHAHQRREGDQAPFILHPLEVAALLSGRGYGEDVIVAGVLHDVLEKTSATAADLRTRFGERVAELVEAVSEDETIEAFAERKAALRERVRRAGPDARAVYAADKIAKARELRAQAACAQVRLDDPQQARRLQHYEDSLRMLREADGESPFVAQLTFELWALRVLPPAG
jgi:(p)ppGpp synthase/HD superfamily hydrolase